MLTTQPEAFLDEVHKAEAACGEDFIVSDFFKDLAPPERPPEIVINQWDNVVDSISGMKKVKVVSKPMVIEELLKKAEELHQGFRVHVERLRNQFRAIKNLKENIGVGHTVVHMDFAENYSCKSYHAIQSEYWGQSQVTIHPIVAYYKKDSDESKYSHTTFCAVSGETEHNSSMVFAIIKKLVLKLRQVFKGEGELHTLDFLTDGPTSQYKNKSIFSIVSCFASLFGLNATWTYFETSHGKGACDGVGGAIKREADNAVKHEKARIQDFSDFAAWLSQYEETSSIRFRVISKEDLAAAKTQLSDLVKDTIAIPDTMKIHSVAGLHVDYFIVVREQSCWCNGCVSGAECHDFSDRLHQWRFCLLSKTRAGIPSVGEICVVKTEDPDYPFYLLEIKDVQKLRRACKDGFGMLQKRGDCVMRGYYFEMKDGRVDYQMRQDTEALVNVGCFVMNLPKNWYGRSDHRIRLSNAAIMKIMNILKIL